MTPKETFILYKTTNVINRKIYVGVHKQKSDFKPYEFDGYLGSGKLLQLAIKKYGKENFIRETIDTFASREDAENAEKHLVNKNFLQEDNVYNVTEGGGSPPYNPTLWLGKTHSEQSKLKISSNRKGKASGLEHWTKNPDMKESYLKMIAINSTNATESNKKIKKALGHKKTILVKMHLSEVNKKLRWYKNLETNQCIFARDCPIGFIPGRILHKSIGE